METTRVAAAGSLVVVTVIALAAGMQLYPESSVDEIIGVIAFFAFLFAIAALLFRYEAIKQAKKLGADLGNFNT